MHYIDVVMTSGLLILHKPAGVSSRRALDRIARLARPAKAGHAGTLDPLASGVLVICVGAGTRLIEFVQRMPKRYRGTFLLGRSSPTEDSTGEVSLLADPPRPTKDELAALLPRFTGRILQRPPAFSALKVAGQRAYDRARRGEEVLLLPREIEVSELRMLHYEYPELALEIACGSGTYIRSLGRDIALAAGTEAVMSGLVRTAIGKFRLEDAVDPESLRPDNWQKRLLPLATAADLLPQVSLSAEIAVRIASGQFIRLPDGTPDELALFDGSGGLLSILRRRPDGSFGAAVNLPPA